MKKEKLADAYIAENLKERANDEFQNLAGFSVILFLFTLIGSLCLVYEFSSAYFWLLLLIPSGLFTYAIVALNIKKKMIQNREYTIVQDRLVQKLEDYPNRNILRFVKNRRRDYRNAFYFSYFGTYSAYYSGENSTFELSDCGDLFLIVVYNNRKEKPVAVYNAKFYAEDEV